MKITLMIKEHGATEVDVAKITMCRRLHSNDGGSALYFNNEYKNATIVSETPEQIVQTIAQQLRETKEAVFERLPETAKL